MRKPREMSRQEAVDLARVIAWTLRQRGLVGEEQYGLLAISETFGRAILTEAARVLEPASTSRVPLDPDGRGRKIGD